MLSSKCAIPSSSPDHRFCPDIERLPYLSLLLICLGRCPIELTKLFHTTSHTLTNCLWSHPQYVTDFFIGETIAIVQVQTGRVFRFHFQQRFMYHDPRLRWPFWPRYHQTSIMVFRTCGVIQSHKRTQTFAVQIA